MKNKIKIFTTLPNKIKVEYIVILTFIINSINYVVYTDNTYDTNNKIRLFVAKYNPNIKEPFIGEPTTKEEWSQVTRIINSVILPK